MPDKLFGGEVSGTPIETRAGTERLSRDILGGGRLQNQATSNALGFNPELVGIERAVMALLADPGDRLQGLFASLVPFEQRQRNEAVAQTRGSFGRLGGRFSTNLLEGEARTQGEVAAQQLRTREESLLTAQGQQGQALASILQAILGARGQTLDFFAPGPVNFQEGIFGDLIEAGGRILAARNLPSGLDFGAGSVGGPGGFPGNPPISGGPGSFPPGVVT